MSTIRSPYQIISDHYAASVRGDLTAMMADVAPHAQWTEMAGFPCAGTHVGPAQVKANVFQVLASQWDSFRFELETLMDAGDRVVAVGSYSGTCRATGKAMKTRTAHVWHVQGGQVQRFEQFTDTLLVAQAMR